MKKPFIVKWSFPGIRFSDGTEVKQFIEQEDALCFIEAEDSKVQFARSDAGSREAYQQANGERPYNAQIECTREIGGKCLMYGCSHLYIVPREIAEKNPFPL